MRLRRASAGDAPALWEILRPIIREGETYPLAPDLDEAGAMAYWLAPAHEVWIAGDGLGTYYLKANTGGPGDHVANAGYAVAPEARGQGVARAMLDHSLARAAERGFLAMQFNLVIETNARAVDTWRRAGFDIVGRLPQAFRHPRHGFVDALVMHRFLKEPDG